jgi:hypothetical protein
MRNHPAIIHLLIFVSLIFYIILGLSGDLRSEIEKYWLIIFPVYLIYILLIVSLLKDNLPHKISPVWYIAFGILFRVALIPSDPFLSDDIYRYLWDGKILSAGINPYKYAPIDLNLLDYRDHIVYPNINFPEIATSYPPVSQFLFLINDLVGGTILSWKLLLLLFEIPLLLLIFKLLKHFRLNQNRILIYFYNPLLIIETYSSGHLEITGVLLLWVAIFLFYKRYEWTSIPVFTLSIMTKFVPFISVIPFLIKKFYRKSTLLIGTCLLLLMPFMFNDILPLPGIFSYANRWEFNGGFYQLILSVLKILEVKEFQWMVLNLSGHLETFYINHALYYKICAVIILLAVIFDQIKKLKSTSQFLSINFIQRSFVITSLFLLLTPTLHPWYLIWIIPFMVFLPTWSWIAFTFLIQASYFVLKDYVLLSEWNESVWILIIQYIPFYVLLVWEYLDRRRINGWFLS